jgi:hypothetical protein
VKPLLMVWEAGPTEIGDFTWPGFDSDVVVNSRALRIVSEFGGFLPGPVKIVEEGGRTKAKSTSDVDREDPSLSELWVTKWVGIDRHRSSADLVHTCARCGTEQWEIFGVEDWTSSYDLDRQRLIRTKTRRESGAGVIVQEDALGADSIFRLIEFPAWVLCTDKVRSAIERAALANVSLLEVGQIV